MWANAQKVRSVIDEGSCWYTTATEQARVVQASVWQEAVGVKVRIAALTGQDIAQATHAFIAYPVIVVVQVVLVVVEQAKGWYLTLDTRCG